MGRYRVTIQEAARRLGVKEAAVRKRIERGTLEKEKDADGRVYVYVEEPAGGQRDGGNGGGGDAGHDARHDESYYASHPMGYDALTESQREQIAFLREQLEAERRAHGEARRLLAAALERIPAIEAPQASPDERGSPETVEAEPEGAEPRSTTPGPQEGAERRSWWRQFFGFE